MLTASPSTRFRKDYKLMEKRGRAMYKIDQVLLYLVNEITLPPQYKEHPLRGDYVGKLECHIEPDWLLVYRIDSENKVLHLARTGTHSDIF
jgi:mRNA interferase YafQ